MSRAADSADPGSSPALEVVSAAARLLFGNGQATESMVVALRRLAGGLGLQVEVFPRWGELTLQIDAAAGSICEVIATVPAAVDMRKVIATMAVIDQAGDGPIDVPAARSALEATAALSPVPIGRFALLAGAGAAALGVIFGAAHGLSLVLIASSAGAGAYLRRWLSRVSHNLFVQPFGAAFLAGAIGAIAVRWELSSVLRLIAVCPCMVLVPGPHILNGAIDLIRGRIPLGAARIVYASLIILMICAGLLLGLGLGGEGLPVSVPSRAVPLGFDVVAAGVAVAAYGTFFAMPWRLLPIPIVIGMFAHALRWVTVSQAGAGPATGALVASLVVGAITTPIADRLRLPFAGLAFAAVVSLIPGVFVFRMAGGMVGLVALGPRAPHELFIQVATDGTTALLIVAAMVFGLLFPKMCFEHFARSISPRRKQR
jgi:uncharacterized membrane protein YjjP (DUF1212 family)